MSKTFQFNMNEVKNINDIIPWWTYGVAILSGILFGAIGTIIIFGLLYGYWYLWKKSVFTFSKKLIFSLVPLITLGIIYIVFFGYISTDNYQMIVDEQNDQTPIQSRESDMITLKNSEYNFEITHPVYWERDSVFNQNIILQLKTKDDLSSITIKEYDTNWTSHQEYLDYTTADDLKGVFDKTNELNLISITNATIDGLKVFKTTYMEQSPMQGGNIQFKVISFYIISDNGKMLGVNYIAYPDSFDVHLSEAETIINSLDFK